MGQRERERGAGGREGEKERMTGVRKKHWGSNL